MKVSFKLKGNTYSILSENGWSNLEINNYEISAWENTMLLDEGISISHNPKWERQEDHIFSVWDKKSVGDADDMWDMTEDILVERVVTQEIWVSCIGQKIFLNKGETFPKISVVLPDWWWDKKEIMKRFKEVIKKDVAFWESQIPVFEERVEKYYEWGFVYRKFITCTELRQEIQGIIPKFVGAFLEKNKNFQISVEMVEKDQQVLEFLVKKGIIVEKTRTIKVRVK